MWIDICLISQNINNLFSFNNLPFHCKTLHDTVMTDLNKILSSGTGVGSSVTSTSVNSRVIHYNDVF